MTTKTLLTEDFRERWAAAVEVYKRGTGCLRNQNDEFCCLGVAVDLLAPQSWERSSSGGWLSLMPREEPRGGYLPKSIQEQIGLGGTDQGFLATKNDQLGTTREDMAKIIRALPARPTPTE